MTLYDFLASFWRVKMFVLFVKLVVLILISFIGIKDEYLKNNMIRDDPSYGGML